jgi:hypothetical protein
LVSSLRHALAPRDQTTRIGGPEPELIHGIFGFDGLADARPAGPNSAHWWTAAGTNPRHLWFCHLRRRSPTLATASVGGREANLIAAIPAQRVNAKIKILKFPKIFVVQSISKQK